jgi:hypothetical protein
MRVDEKVDAALAALPRMTVSTCLNCHGRVAQQHRQLVLARDFPQVPTQALASYAGRNEFMVGISGNASSRDATVTASGRNLPALMYSIDGGRLGKSGLAPR